MGRATHKQRITEPQAGEYLKGPPNHTRWQLTTPRNILVRTGLAHKEGKPCVSKS